VQPSSDPNVRTRAILATVIICISISGIIGLSLVAVFTVAGADRTEMARQVFSAVLPLLGTWVGTVLAFYFARESLQAATDSTSQLVGRPDPHSPVSQVMISYSQIVSHVLSPGQAAGTVALEGLLNAMHAVGKHRIPIIEPDGSVAYIVHEATITKFIAIPPVPAAGGAPPAHPLAGKTLADLLARPDLAELVKAMGFVAVTATIADARGEMGRIPQCNDVFVTSRGRSDEPIVGWMTNTDLASMS
jgi:hypothetical protein